MLCFFEIVTGEGAKDEEGWEDMEGGGRGRGGPWEPFLLISGWIKLGTVVVIG